MDIITSKSGDNFDHRDDSLLPCLNVNTRLLATEKVHLSVMAIYKYSVFYKPIKKKKNNSRAF